jgi:hypothetical protein
LTLTERGRLAAFVLSVILFFILNFVAGQPAEALFPILRLIAYYSLPFLGGFIALLLGSVASNMSIRGSSVALDLIRDVSAAPARNFMLGFFASAYLILVRPRLASSVSFLIYCEWIVAVFAVYLVYSMTGFSVKEFYDRSEGLGWRKHVQEISPETGRDFKQLTAVMDQFISQGIKEPLLVYLALYLQRLGRTEQEILDILYPLVHFRGDAERHKVRYLLFPRARNKHVMAIKKARENLVEVLFERIHGARSE